MRPATPNQRAVLARIHHRGGVVWHGPPYGYHAHGPQFLEQFPAEAIRSLVRDGLLELGADGGYRPTPRMTKHDKT